MKAENQALPLFSATKEERKEFHAKLKQKHQEQKEYREKLFASGLITPAELNIIWDALYGRRCDCFGAGDKERWQGIEDLMQKIGIPE